MEHVCIASVHVHVVPCRCEKKRTAFASPVASNVLYSLGQNFVHKTETGSFRHRLHSHSSTSVLVRLTTARQLTQLATGGMSATESRCSALEVPLNTAVLSH